MVGGPARRVLDGPFRRSEKHRTVASHYRGSSRPGLGRVHGPRPGPAMAIAIALRIQRALFPCVQTVSRRSDSRIEAGSVGPGCRPSRTQEPGPVEEGSAHRHKKVRRLAPPDLNFLMLPRAVARPGNNRLRSRTSSRGSNPCPAGCGRGRSCHRARPQRRRDGPSRRCCAG